LKSNNEFPHFSCEDKFVDIYGQDVDELINEESEDSRVDERLSGAVGDESRRQEGVPCLWSFSNAVEGFLQVAN